MVLPSKVVWIEAGVIKSPVVGRLVRLEFDSNDSALPALVGEVEQLGRLVALVTTEHLGCVTLKCTPPCEVFVGTALAEIGRDVGKVSEKQPIALTATDKAELKIEAPSDGYLIFTDASGSPYFKPGDRVQAKQVLALIELMKLRVAIRHEGSVEMRFVSYDAQSHQAIRKGESICRLSLE